MSNVERYYKYLRKCEMMGKEATFEFEVDEEKDKVTLIRYNETDEDFRVFELPSFVTHIGIYPFFSVRQSLKIIHKDNKIKDMPWFMSGYDGKRLDLSEFDTTGVKETMFMFGSNIRLETIELSDNLKSMGNYAFRKCESLKEIVIPDSVEAIGLFCFSECESLKRLVISKSLDRLENDAINNCYNIKEIVIRSNNTEVDTGIKRRFNVKYEVI